MVDNTYLDFTPNALQSHASDAVSPNVATVAKSNTQRKPRKLKETTVDMKHTAYVDDDAPYSVCQNNKNKETTKN